ncbi:MAG: TIGR00725 family protein [Candidatus Aminicenantes bacterium]|nr:TIGR00725 family protein [Candidatus Aminicenantes bacterium]
MKKNIRKQVRIGIIGGAKPNPESRKTAYETGRLIAEKQAVLVCGGLSGVMEAAARGHKEAGGVSIGILPGSSTKDANPYIDIPIATGLGYTRNSLVVMNSDVLIAIDGHYGTLSEIAYGFIQDKKVIGLGTWDINGILKADSPEQAVELALKPFFPLVR